MPSTRQKIALFVCDDLIGIEMANSLIPRIKAAGLDPVIYNTGSKLNRQFKVPAPQDIKFYGVELLRDIALPFIETNSTQNPDDTWNDSTLYSYKQLAKRYGINYHEIEDVNDPAFINHIIADDTLVGGISIRFLQIFDREIINVFKEKGFIWNLHGGALPEYKGLLIPAWAIANGEKAYGWTLHRLDTHIDTGQILSIASIPLDPKRPILKIYQDMIPKGIELITNELQHFQECGPPKGKPQTEEEKVSYYPYPTASQWKNFKSRGISFAHPIQTIEDYVEKFTVPTTTEAQAFRHQLIQAVAEHERSKHPAFEAQLYHDLQESGYDYPANG